MMLLALVPPLWFRVMNPRVEKFMQTIQQKRSQILTAKAQ